LFGAVLAGLRRGFYAVRTEDGIERRLRTAPANADTAWTRLADFEYDPTYDRYLTVLLFVLGIGTFAAIPVVDPQDATTVLRLVALGLFGLVAAVLLSGTART
jgi:hypothetical protein